LQLPRKDSARQLAEPPEQAEGLFRRESIGIDLPELGEKWVRQRGEQAVRQYEQLVSVHFFGGKMN